MNRKINTRLSITIIIFFAFLVAIYALIRGHNFNVENNTQIIATGKSLKKSDTCRVRAFKGLAEISVWQITKDGKTFLQVDKKDMHKLPVNDASDFKLIDSTPEIEKEIASSSEKNPVKLSISGFATFCDGTNLACGSYKDGIFRPYIN